MLFPIHNAEIHIYGNSQLGSTGAAYRISDFQYSADTPHKPPAGYKATPFSRAIYCPEIQPTLSLYLSAMKGKTAPCCQPTHTAQSSW